MYKTQPKSDSAKEVLKFVDWPHSNDGNKLASQLDYVLLPKTAVNGQ